MADELRTIAIVRAHALGPWGVVVPIAIAIAGATAAVWLAARSRARRSPARSSSTSRSRRAPFDGMRIRYLGLPPGAIVVTVRREGGEHVPNAEFRLAAGDRVTAVVGAEAAAAVPRLREGAGAGR